MSLYDRIVLGEDRLDEYEGQEALHARGREIMRRHRSRGMTSGQARQKTRAQMAKAIRRERSQGSMPGPGKSCPPGQKMVFGRCAEV